MDGRSCPPADLKGFFSPRSIAVIGASSDPTKLGYKLVNNIVSGGYGGEVHPVNPRGGSILGRRVYRKISDIKGDIDLAMISLPADLVNGALAECGEKGIPYAIVVSAGFRETGNVEGEERIVETAKRYGMRVLGPNVFGFIYTPASLNAQFGPSHILPGKVAIITQSGALGASLMGKVVDEGIGISGVVSTGNKADLDDVDLLSFFCSDPNTDAILMYIEGLKDGRRFLEVIGDLTRTKPIVVLKSGRTEEGARVVRSHTASLAGSDRVFEGAFSQFGVMRAKTVEEALEWTRALVDLPPPTKDNVLIITNGGGLGAIAVDGLMEAGIPLYDDLEWIGSEMGRIYPSYATFNNPVDITAQASYGLYLNGLERTISEPTVGSVIGIYSPTAGADMDDFTRGIIRTVKGAKKPVLLCSFGGRAAMDQIVELGKHGVHAFYYPEEAVSTLAALFKYAKIKDRPSGRTEGRPRNEGPALPVDVGSGFVDPARCLDLLDRIGVRTAERRTVTDRSGLLAAAKEMGYPLVLKAISKGIVHKTEKKAVEVGIQCDVHLMGSYERMKSLSTEHLLMRHENGIETIAGGFMDPVFGACVMFGAGGTMVEYIDDVQFRIAPIDTDQALEMVRSTRIGPILEKGFRGGDPVDIEEVAGIIVKLGDLLVSEERITEIEINPLICGREGPIAVDCRVRVK